MLASAAPGSIPRLSAAGVDGAVLLFALLVGLVTTGFFSIAPIARLVRLDPVQSLKEGGQSTAGARGSAFGRRSSSPRWRSRFCCSSAPGLMIRSLWAMQRVPLGFDPRGVLTVRVALTDDSYPTSERIVSFYERLTAEVRPLPGVTAAGAVRSLPLGATIGDWGLDVEGYVETPGRNAKGDWQVVTPGALEALGERVVAGRGFTAADRADALPGCARQRDDGAAVLGQTAIRSAAASAWDPTAPAHGSRSSGWCRTCGTTASRRR